MLRHRISRAEKATFTYSPFTLQKESRRTDGRPMSHIKVTQPGLNSQPFNAQAALLSQHHSDMSRVYTLMRENHREPGNLLRREAGNRTLLPPDAITKFAPMSASPYKHLSGQSHTDRTAARRVPPNVWFKHSNRGGVGGMCTVCLCVHV